MTAFGRAVARILGVPMRPTLRRTLSAVALCVLIGLVCLSPTPQLPLVSRWAPATKGNRGVDDGYINVMYAVSGSDIFAVAGCMRSIFANSATPPEKICVHIAVETSAEMVFADDMMREIFHDVPDLCLRVAVFDFFPDHRLMFDTRPDLYVAVNYARYYIEDLFPGVDRMVYLDYDTVVQADIAELYQTDMRGLGLGAVENCEFELRAYLDLNLEHPFILDGRYDPAACTFIAGVLLIDVAYWREHGIRAKLEAVMRANLDAWPDYIYERGSQSPLSLVFGGGQYHKLNRLWQVYDLGWNSPKPPSADDLEHGKVLHWNGRRKPWRSDGLYQEKWRPYFPGYEKYMRRPAPTAPPGVVYHDLETQRRLKPRAPQGLLLIGAPPSVERPLVQLLSLGGIVPVEPGFARLEGATTDEYLSDKHVTSAILRLEELKRSGFWVGADTSASAVTLMRRGVLFKVIKVVVMRNVSMLTFNDERGDVEMMCRLIGAGRPPTPSGTLDIDLLAQRPMEQLQRLYSFLHAYHAPVKNRLSIDPKAVENAAAKLRDALSREDTAPAACRVVYEQGRT